MDGYQYQENLKGFQDLQGCLAILFNEPCNVNKKYDLVSQAGCRCRQPRSSVTNNKSLLLFNFCRIKHLFHRLIWIPSKLVELLCC
jgi:hypothetical protein